MPKPRFALGTLTLLLVGMVAPASAAPARAERPGRFTVEHAIALRSIADPRWSADGRRLAFVVTEPDTAENTSNQDLWLYEPGRGEPARRLTRHPGADLGPTFSPSGDTLAFTASRSTGEDARAGIWMMSLRGGEPWLHSSGPEGVSEVHWSPDGRWLACTMADTLPANVRAWRRKKWDHVVEDERLQPTRLWLIEVATGLRRALTSEKVFLWWVRWSPDSKHLACIVSPTGKPDDGNAQDLGVVPVAGGPIRRLGVIGGPFAWSPDGRSIAIATGADRRAHVQPVDLFVAPLAGGAPRNLTAAFDENASQPCWSAGGDTLFFHLAEGVTTRLAAVPAIGGAVRLLADRAAEAGAMEAARTGALAWVQSDPTHPAELWVAPHPGLPGQAVTNFHGDVARLALGHTRTVRWTSDDGVNVEGLLVRPPGAPARAALKTVVQLHGGPYGSRNTLAFQLQPQLFAAAGYQVFLPNFRSSGGYGSAFLLRRRADWGGQEWRDVTSGLDSLVRQGLADSARLGVYGRSYGGYLSAWAITQTGRFDAAGVFAGAVDLGAHYGQSDIQRYRAFDFGGPPWEMPEAWRRSSPITHIARVRTPTLIQVGDNDARVPMAQSRQFYVALRELGVPVEFVHYPREGHTLREPRHRADHLARLVAWFDRWVK